MSAEMNAYSSQLSPPTYRFHLFLFLMHQHRHFLSKDESVCQSHDSLICWLAVGHQQTILRALFPGLLLNSYCKEINVWLQVLFNE